MLYKSQGKTTKVEDINMSINTIYKITLDPMIDMICKAVYIRRLH